MGTLGGLIISPVGAIIGGICGLLSGWFSSDEASKMRN